MRFQEKGRYLRSFVAPESLFIDIMMNVPIIFYAARETGDQALYDLAVEHCRTTERTIVRPDGGTAHEGIFNVNTGEFLRESTHQGLRADSDWTRGLAWSLYGFGTVFTYTNDPADRAVAERNADHFLDRLGPSGVPPWDFDVPEGPDRIDDSSAGAIAASGLWNLARIASSPQRSDRYRAGRPPHSRRPPERPLRRLERPRLGRRAQARRVPLPQETGRRRVRHVGRILLPGGRRQGPGRVVTMITPASAPLHETHWPTAPAHATFPHLQETRSRPGARGTTTDGHSKPAVAGAGITRRSRGPESSSLPHPGRPRR